MDTLKLWRGSGKAARRTGHSVSFFLSSRCVSYILTIIEMLRRLRLYRGMVRRLQKGKRPTSFGPSVSGFFFIFWVFSFFYSKSFL